MKTFLSLLIVSALSIGSMSAEPKISIFCNHIEAISRQEKISFTEAAKLVREIGYTGVDVFTSQDPRELDILDSLGFQHSSAIVELNFGQDAQEMDEQKALDFLVRRHYDKVLLVSGLLDENASKKDMKLYKSRVASFVAKTKALGIQTTFEDYDHMLSPMRNIAGLAEFFSCCPDAFFTMDSGNFLFSGEDCLKALYLFRDKITHVHLKDRASASDMSCPAVGTGCIPITALIRSLVSSGYDGWFTAEMFGNKTILAAVTISYENILKAINLSDDQMTPDMTELYAPEVPVVTPPMIKYSKAPKGAKILFDGSDLSCWKSTKGIDANWTLNGDGTMTVNKKNGSIITKDSFGSFRLHIEWMAPEGITGEGQERGNSGVFLHNLYEIQILDSYGNKTYSNGQAGSVYKQSIPLANPCVAPGFWNVYDIIFTAPVFTADGKLVKRPRVTLVFNGVTVQDDYEIIGTTEYIGLPKGIWKESGPILLQSHGDRSQPISFRNIWIKEF